MAEEASAPVVPDEEEEAAAATSGENGGENGGAEAGAGSAEHPSAPAAINNDNPDAGGGGGDAPPAAAADDAAGGVDADAAAPDAAPDAPEEGGGGDAAAGNDNDDDNPPLAALAGSLASYFAALSSALRRQNGNSATGGMRGSSSLSAMLVEGATLIAAAGNESYGPNAFLAFERSSFPGPADNGAAANGGGNDRPAEIVTPPQAALYLYAVAQNIVALEAAVLGSRPSAYAAAGGGMMDGMDGGGGGGGVTAKKVAEIISAVSTAATFCNSRSIISQSGILPALAHLIESTGNVTLPPSSLMKQSKRGSNAGVLHALTPFHPEFLQVCLLAGQYRYASSFLAHRPTSHMILDFPYLRIEATSYLRTHYYAGLVHIGCADWNAALDSFHLCLTVPCSTVSAISTAARKKSLLVQCLLLESDELDGNGNAFGEKSNVQGKTGGGGSGGKTLSALESKVLDLPGAASASVCKFMSAQSNRVERRESATTGSGSAPERTAGSETSEQPSGRERSSRRRVRSANSSSSDAPGGGDRASEGGSKSKNAHLGSYHELVSTYISGNASHYSKLLAEMTAFLHADGNWGLAKQLEGRLLAYRSIRKVASVYSVVGVDMLEKKMQEGESAIGEVGKRGLEDVLMGMAACDSKDALLADPFVARIDQSTGMVSFLDGHDDDDSSDDDDDDEEQMEADLSRRLESCIALAERVRDLDIVLTTSPKYQQHVMKEKMMKGDRGASAMMKQQAASVADIGQGPMDIGVDW